MLWVKTFHIFFVIAWFAGLFYLPRIFVNLAIIFSDKNIFHSYSENTSFIEDYAFLIQCLLDLFDATMNPKYRLLAKKYCDEAIEKFYDWVEKNENNN